MTKKEAEGGEKGTKEGTHVVGDILECIVGRNSPVVLERTSLRRLQWLSHNPQPVDGGYRTV